MKNDISSKRLLTTKEFMEYTGFGPNTAEYFGRFHKIRRKIGNRWRYDKIKTDEVINKLFDVKED